MQTGALPCTLLGGFAIICAVIGRGDLVKRNQVGFVVALLPDQNRLLVRASQLIGVICDLVVILESLALRQE